MKTKKPFKMNKKLKAKWVAALRSGEYRQTTGCLKEGDCYCCLGVLAEVAGKRIRPEQCFLSNRVLPVKHREVIGSHLGFWKDEVLFKDASVQVKLAHLNDVKGWSFKKIAGWIQRNL